MPAVLRSHRRAADHHGRVSRCAIGRIVAALAAPVALACAPVAGEAATIRLAAHADASIRSDRPSAHAPRARRLYVRARRPQRRAFLRFAVPLPAGARVTGATLVMDAVARSGRPVVALRHVSAAGWSAARLDWRHQPRLARIAARARLVRRGRLTLDATRVVPAGGGAVAMALTARRGSASFASSEAPRGRPLLVVRTTGGAGAPPPGRYAWRGMYDRQADGGFARIAAAGFNLIDSGPGDVDELSHGLKGLTWVGDYDNDSCSWEVPDAALASEVRAHRNDPHVGVWFISDEPDPYACPHAYQQHAARSALIHAIDPDTPTLIVLDSNSGRQSLNQMAGWKGAADIIGLDPYPCYQGGRCRYGWIDAVTARADAVGLPYWGVVQAFGDPPGDGQWRLPTPAELHQEFVHWRASAMTGYLVFAWRWPSGHNSLWLANHPELQAQLRTENGG
jgi:hypothetical protein